MFFFFFAEIIIISLGITACRSGGLSTTLIAIASLFRPLTISLCNENDCFMEIASLSYYVDYSFKKPSDILMIKSWDSYMLKKIYIFLFYCISYCIVIYFLQVAEVILSLLYSLFLHKFDWGSLNLNYFFFRWEENIFKIRLERVSTAFTYYITDLF